MGLVWCTIIRQETQSRSVCIPNGDIAVSKPARDRIRKIPADSRRAPSGAGPQNLMLPSAERKVESLTQIPRSACPRSRLCYGSAINADSEAATAKPLPFLFPSDPCQNAPRLRFQLAVRVAYILPTSLSLSFVDFSIPSFIVIHPLSSFNERLSLAKLAKHGVLLLGALQWSFCPLDSRFNWFSLKNNH